MTISLFFSTWKNWLSIIYKKKFHLFSFTWNLLFSFHLFHLFWKQTGEFFRKCIFLLLFTIICNNVRELYMQCNYDAIFLDNKKFKRNKEYFLPRNSQINFFLHIFLWWRSPSYVLTFFSDMFSYFSHIFSDSALFSHVFSYFSLIVLTIICDECFRDADATASILENLGERNVHKM